MNEQDVINWICRRLADGLDPDRDDGETAEPPSPTIPERPTFDDDDLDDDLDDDDAPPEPELLPRRALVFAPVVA